MTHLTSGIGKMIRALRKSRGMTQDDLAAMVGLQRTSICNIELGRQNLTTESINAIAAALGYEVRVRFVRRAPRAATPENFA